jgi:hypothetical protein
MPAPNLVSGFFLSVITVAIVLTILIVILPSGLFLALSNYLQIIAALAGALVLLYAWHRTGRQKVLLLAGAGFGIWGIANIGWYVMTFLGFRNLVFPGVIDIGLVLGLLLIAVALWTRLPGQKPAPATIIAILVLSLAVQAGMVLVSGFSLPAALATFSYFVSCGFLTAAGLCITNRSRPLLAAGAILLGVPHMIYPLREIYLASDPILLVIGPVICAGFALIVLGLLPSCGPAAEA